LNNQEQHSPAQKIMAEIEHLLPLTGDAIDHILDACDAIKGAGQDAATIDDAVMQIYEICARQDIIRQRLEKISRIAARIDNPDLPDDDALLEGPQSGHAALSQHDTDQLMNSDD
jgi:hypothetical protein